jgi:hypothetical protein
MCDPAVEPFSPVEARLASRLHRWSDRGVVAVDAAQIARQAASTTVRPGLRVPSWIAYPLAAVVAAIAVAGGLVGLRLTLPSTGAPDASSASIEAIWPGFRLLSSEAAGISIQVPESWNREVAFWPDDAEILEEGTGNAGLSVIRAPLDEPDLKSAVDAILVGLGNRPLSTRIEITHGTHRAVRMEARQPERGGGSILYVVEKLGGPPYVVTLRWDSVPSLGNVEDAILRSFNPDGPGPAVVAPSSSGSAAWVTMTDQGCTVAGPQVASVDGRVDLTLANPTTHVADFNLLSVGSAKAGGGYDELAAAVDAAALAIGEGRDPVWPPSGSTSWITDRYVQPGSAGTLSGLVPPGTHAVMCFPVGERNESLGVYLTLPFEVVDPAAK